MKRPVSIADLFSTRTVSDARISPDGRWVAFVATEADLKENRYNADIHLVPAEGGNGFRLTSSPKRDDTPRWSPDGSCIAFLSGREEKVQVYVIRPFGGEAERLTDARSGVSAFEWSPDGRRIAYLAPDALTGEEEKEKKERGDARVVDRDDRMVHLHVLDLGTKEARRLTTGRFHVTSLTWSPEGRHVAIAHQPSPLANDMFRATLSVVPASGGRQRRLTDGRGDVASPVWSPDGRWIAFLSRGPEGDWLDSMHIRLVAPAGGPVRDLTPRLEDLARFSESAWSPDGRSLYILLGQGTSIQIARVRLNGRMEHLTRGGQVYSAMSSSADGRKVAFIRQDGATAPDVYISSAAPFEPRRVTTLNPQVSGRKYGRKEVIRWKSEDGTPVEGLLVRPAGYRRGRRYPLLVCVHGGPMGVFSNTFDGVGQGVYPVGVFAGRGYALLLPNPRGSSHYGDAFRKANLRDWGGGDYADIMSGVDYLVARGIADPDRLGIMGWSYGGYMTAWVISQTDRFRAASFGAGMTNLISMYGQTDIPGFLEDYFEARPWSDVETYVRHSPMGHAGRIRTPTLIQHGEKDVRVPLPQSYELYQALKRRRIPAEFVIYPRQGHGLSEPKHIRDAMERNLAWFEAWVRKKTVRRQTSNVKRKSK